MSAPVAPLNLALRPMNRADVTAVMEVERRAYNYPWTAGIFRDCLQVGYCCWVVEQAGRLVAYGVMSAAAGEAHVLNLAVDPELQGRGIGARLLAHLLGLAQGHGAEMVFLEVRPSNLAALRLYEKAGFNEIGRRRRYYPADRGREDAVVMGRSLAVGPGEAE